MDKKRGVITISGRIFLSHSAKKFHRELFNISENLEYRKILCIIGEYRDFLSKNFSLTVPKNFLGNLSVFRKFLIWKKLWIRGEVSRFSVKIVLYHSTESFHRGTLLCCVSENFGYRKILCLRGEWGISRFSVENFLSHCAEKYCRGIL